MVSLFNFASVDQYIIFAQTYLNDELHRLSMNTTDILRKVHRSGLATRPLRFVSQRYGENVYNRDWDVLIILDAAQYKIVREMSDEYDYIESVDRLKSRGSHSSEWCYNTFVTDWNEFQEDIQRTNYITGNVITSLILNGASDMEFLDDDEYIDEAVNETDDHERINRLKSYHPVWKGSLDIDEDYIPPDLLTNRFLDYLPEITEEDRTILHYMQPHTPFVNANSEETRVWPNNNDSVSMFNTERSVYQELMNNYRANHEYILDHLRILLNQIPNDMEVVVSADHGNITNEILGVPYTFGHPNYVFFSRDLRHVPWIRIDQSKAQDPGSELSDISYNNDTHSSEEVLDRLEHLGYK